PTCRAEDVVSTESSNEPTRIDGSMDAEITTMGRSPNAAAPINNSRDKAPMHAITVSTTVLRRK
ncbi:MAG: hypothetical protein L0K03_03800, partial [Bifidobacterium crudilactis]|nr:hypothetical protein [Bifidobacterium crudilactis]